MTESAPDTNPTQLVRYVIQIPALTDDANIAHVRQVLTGLGLLVDRIENGEAEVAAAHATDLGTKDIVQALKQEGYEADISTQLG
jgi:hypothetical protein